MACIPVSRDWFDYLVAIGPTPIAVYVAWVAYQQWQTNRNKLRLDLYNRRFEVYTNTITFFQALSSLPAGEPDEEFVKIHKSFIRSYKESQFLFGKETKVFDLLKQLHSDAFKVIGLKRNGSEISRSGGHEVYISMVLDANATLGKFDAAIQQLEVAMPPYLKFRMHPA